MVRPAGFGFKVCFIISLTISFSPNLAFHPQSLRAISSSREPGSGQLCPDLSRSPDNKLQPEVVYSGQGSSVKEDGDKGKYNISYTNVPVLVKYELASGLNIETGPQLGILLSAKVKADGGGSTDIKHTEDGSIKNGVLQIGFFYLFGKK